MPYASSLVAAVVTQAASVGAALAYVALNGWFGAGDLRAMALWSLPLSLLVFLVFQAVLRPKRLLVRYLVGVGGALGLSVTWAMVAALLLGEWIRAFSFPVLLCWGSGSVLGVTAGLSKADRRSAWPSLAVALVAALALLQGFNRYEIPAPGLVLYLRAGVSEVEIEAFSRELLGEPHPSGRGFSWKPGISGVTRTGQDGSHKTLVVSFWRGTAEVRRRALADTVSASPFVDHVLWTGGGAHGDTR